MKLSPLALSHAYQLSCQYDAKLATQQAYQLGCYLWAHFPPYINQQTLLATIPMYNQQIKAIAWETLYHPQKGFLALQPHYALVRTPPKFSPYKQALYAKPFRILLFTVDSDDEKNEPLATAEEQYHIRTLCYQWQQKGYAVELHSPMCGTVNDFEYYLSIHHWDLVILSTHTLLTATGELLLCFEKQQRLSPKQLAALCQKANIHHLVLAACASGCCTVEENFVDALLDVGVSQFVVMRTQILDRAAHTFIYYFIAHLLMGHTFAQSVQLGRIALLHLLKEGECWQKEIDTEIINQQWSLPILYSRAPLHYFVILKKDYPHSPTPLLGFGQRLLITNILKQFQQGQKAINIVGRAGIGKSHCAKMILYQCYEMGIQPISATEITASAYKKEHSYIIYFDNVNPKHIPELLMNLCERPQNNIYTLVTSRTPLTMMLTQYLKGLAERDFLHYAAYLGINYSTVQLRFIYRTIAGHPQSLALLRNISPPKDHQKLKQCVAYLKRYLAAL